jgi:hypothetical protein
MYRYSLLVLFALCGCSTSGGLDGRTAPRGGSTEDSLLSAIRRPPPQRANIPPSLTTSVSQPEPQPEPETQPQPLPPNASIEQRPTTPDRT